MNETKSVIFDPKTLLVTAATFANLQDNQPLKAYATLAEIIGKHDIRADKNGIGFTPARYKPDSVRGIAGVEAAWGICSDFDKDFTTEVRECLFARLRRLGYAFCAWTTHSNGDPLKGSGERWRLLLFLDRDIVLNEDNHRLWHGLQDGLFGEMGALADKSTKDISRYSLLPSCPPERAHLAMIEWGEGRRIEVDKWLGPEKKRQLRARAPDKVATRTTKYGAKILAGALEKIATAEDGNRTSTFFAQAIWVFRHVAGGEIRAKEAEEKLLDAAKNAGLFAAYGEEDVERQFENARDLGLEEPLSKAVVAQSFNVQGEGMVSVPLDDKGRPVYSAEILSQILAEDSFYGADFSLDVVKGQLQFRGEAIRDSDYTRLRVAIMARYGFLNVPKADVIDCVDVACEGNPQDRVKNYLEGVTWDGEARLGRAAGELLGAEGDLAAVMLRKWFVSAVARGLDPGCKADTCLILQGPQGTYKSTFFNRLVPDDDLFSDSMPHDLTDKDSREFMSKFWIVEYGEWEGLYKKTDISALRTFLSTRSDSFRAPYKRVNETHKRRAVLVGTVNPIDGILRDPEGTRRQWVVECKGNIDLELLDKWRDQLWGEAVVAYKKGEQWWLDEEEDRARAEVAELKYVEDDPVLEALENAVERLLNNAQVQAQGHVTMHDLAMAMGHVSAQDLKTAVARKAGNILRRAGCTRSRTRVEGGQKRVWQLPSDGSHSQEAKIIGTIPFGKDGGTHGTH